MNLKIFYKSGKTAVYTGLEIYFVDEKYNLFSMYSRKFSGHEKCLQLDKISRYEEF